jgi:selenide,water dikinase
LLQTVDFFRAMVGDPYLFGRIAATHALGDIYAMGGTPETALAIAALPPARPPITQHDLYHMLKGGTEVLEAAGAMLIGGHSAEGSELALGFAVTGRIQPGRLTRKGGLRVGDRLILTKPLGTGVILAGEMRGRAKARDVQHAIETMLQPAAAAAAIFATHGATACTDVTGFGLLGHLSEMLAASSADARLDPGAIPALDGALDLIAAGIASSLHAGNLSALAALVDADPRAPLAALLIDPQTAGGLLAGIPADQADACLSALLAAGYRAAAIGVVDAGGSAKPLVRLDPPRPRRAALGRPRTARGRRGDRVLRPRPGHRGRA